MRYQNPVADAAARDAAGRLADPLQSTQAAQRAADAWPGAQGVAGQYGARYASGLYAAASTALLAGNVDSANALLQRAQLGQVAKDATGRITYTDARGYIYPAMPAASAAAFLQTLTAQSPTALQQYTDAATRGTGTLTPAQESQKGILEHRIQTLDKAIVNALDDTERGALQQQRDEATRALGALFGGSAPASTTAFDALGFGARMNGAPAMPLTARPASPPAPAASRATSTPASLATANDAAGADFEIDYATGTIKRQRQQPDTADALDTYRDAAQRWREAERKRKEAQDSHDRYTRTGKGVDRSVAIERYTQFEVQARSALLAARAVYQRAQQEDASERQRRTAQPTAPQTTTHYGITLPSYGVEPYQGPLRP